MCDHRVIASSHLSAGFLETTLSVRSAFAQLLRRQIWRGGAKTFHWQ